MPGLLILMGRRPILFAINEQQITEILPLGGAGLLFIWLLRLLLVERRQWVAERSMMLEEHRHEREEMLKRHQTERDEIRLRWGAELERKDEELRRKDEDRERSIAFLRERVQRLEAELETERERSARLRDQLRAVEG